MAENIPTKFLQPVRPVRRFYEFGEFRLDPAERRLLRALFRAPREKVEQFFDGDRLREVVRESRRGAARQVLRRAIACDSDEHHRREKRYSHRDR